MTTLPLWLWVAGVVVLGITLAYGLLRNRTRTSRERAITEEATKENCRQKIGRPNSEPPAEGATLGRRNLKGPTADALEFLRRPSSPPAFSPLTKLSAES
jgi:hypothetical protein